jgi:hypothetical protein
MDPSTQYAAITGFDWRTATFDAPLHQVFLIVSAFNNNSTDTPTQCTGNWSRANLASGPVFDALFAPAGSTVPGSDIPGLGLYPATWWQRNIQNAMCWHGSDFNPGNDYRPDCQPYANNILPAGQCVDYNNPPCVTTAAAWTQPTPPGAQGFTGQRRLSQRRTNRHEQRTDLRASGRARPPAGARSDAPPGHRQRPPARASS